jgi:hypothetical protein
LLVLAQRTNNIFRRATEGITAIDWTVYGKVASVTKNTGGVTYLYGPDGQRVAKTVGGVTTHYVRDASGNVMAIYENNVLKELPIYGSARLGVYKVPATGLLTERDKLTLGRREYEITNHLGNVLAVVSDAKLPAARVLSHTDYYAFGSAMAGRSGGSPYRHGFNTQERSPELAPDHHTAEFWEYDAGIRRRWNLDPRPVTGTSEYAVLGNNPALFNDIKGDTIIFPKPRWLNDNRAFSERFEIDMSRIYRGALGKSLIRHLHSSEVLIGVQDASRFYLSDEQDLFNSTTTGSYPSGFSAEKGFIQLEYAQREGIVVEKGKSTVWSSSYLVLTHEFVHAKDIASGFLKKLVLERKLDLNLVREIAEIRALAYTNMVAKENGANEVRTKYREQLLLKEDGVPPIKDYGFDIMEGLFPSKNETQNTKKKDESTKKGNN